MIENLNRKHNRKIFEKRISKPIYTCLSMSKPMKPLVVEIDEIGHIFQISLCNIFTHTVHI